MAAPEHSPDYRWLKRGRQRILVIRDMEPNHPVTGEELRKKLNYAIKDRPKLSLREISRHLTSFEKKGMVKCLDSDQPYGRHYILTKKGERIKKNVKP
ncbi:MAG: hypothetical protein ABIB71_00050 [Candidatus Woesearchaeota archaeon]